MGQNPTEFLPSDTECRESPTPALPLLSADYKWRSEAGLQPPAGWSRQLPRVDKQTGWLVAKLSISKFFLSRLM